MAYDDHVVEFYARQQREEARKSAPLKIEINRLNMSLLAQEDVFDVKITRGEEVQQHSFCCEAELKKFLDGMNAIASMSMFYHKVDIPEIPLDYSFKKMAAA